MIPKLEVRGLSFSYGSREVLRDLSFSVMPQEFVSILGASGGGKSTILNLLSGSLTPDAGEMRVDGAPFTGVSGHFAYMPQSDLLFSWQTILENVCLYGRIHGHCKEALEEAKPRFAEFGLAGCENLYPASLSGGMRQRAAFLRTSLCSADILLLDEPFGALDVISRGDMQEWLLSMRKRLSRTALLVTHDVDEAIYLSNRILILGGSPAHIVREFTITEPNRTREWLFDQGALRGEIYRCIKGEGA
ncbi:MAG: ABC transporter ATP-binding protein [Candidatus Ventricola sp.]|nr:ABC transporter ATP-binding protein [Candidatus Ventricola sp.]MDY4855579.1 ABC transporter ATP-binding protein [Candidatus Ventricola sp.]